MALRPEDLEFMQQYASGAPPADLRSRLDSMYGPVTPEMQAAAFGGGDARTAQMSVEPDLREASGAGSGLGYQYDPSQLQPIASPVATDAGGVKAPTMGAVADSRSAMPTVVDPGAPYAPVPKDQMQIGLQPPAQQQPTGPYDPGVEALYRESIKMGMGGGGHMQPGGEQLSGRTVERELRGKVSPETIDALENANLGAQGLAVEQGELASKSLEMQAEGKRKEAQAAHASLASYDRDIAAKQTERDIRTSELDDMREDIKRNPTSYWSGNTGDDAVKAIGLTMLGILGGPRMIMQVVEADLAHKEKARELGVGMLQDRLNRFEKTLPNPEAAQMYRRSLSLGAMAAEAEQLAMKAKSEEVRQRGFAIAEDMRIREIQARAQAEGGLLGKEEIKTANVAPKYVGGKQPKTLFERAKATGMKPIEQARFEETKQLPTGSTGPGDDLELSKHKYARSLTVRLPDGTDAAAHDDDEAKSARKVLEGVKQLNANYDDTLKIVRDHGGSAKWDAKALGRIRANIADTKLALKEAKELGVMSESDERTIAPLTGADAEGWIPGAGFEGAMKRAKELLSAAEQRTREKLTVSPWSNEYITTPAGGSGSTFKAEE